MKPLELEEYWDRFLDKFWKEHDRRNVVPKEMPYTVSANGNSNAAGVINFNLWNNNTGYAFDITRMLIVGDGIAPNAPYTNAAAYLWFFFGDPNSFNIASVFDFAPNAANGPIYPLVKYYSKNTDPIVPVNGDLAVNGVIAANQNLTITLSGYLKKDGAIV